MVRIILLRITNNDTICENQKDSDHLSVFLVIAFYVFCNYIEFDKPEISLIRFSAS